MKQLAKRAAVLALALALTLALALPAWAEEAAPVTKAAYDAAAAAMTYGGAVSIQYALWQDGEITPHNLSCPCCGSLRLQLLSGKEFYIKSMEVDIDGDKSTASDHGLE